MKRHGQLMAKVADQENLRLAFWKAAKGKRGHPDCLAFERDGALIVLNAGPGAVELSADLTSGRSVVLASQPTATPQHVPSDTCIWLSPAR